MGFESLIGNALAWMLKNKSQYATKAIPIALFVWNTFYIMIRAFDPSLIPDTSVQGANVTPIGYAVGYDSLFVNVGWFGSFTGLFVTAAQETAKQMALHAVSKNTFGQYLLPILNSKFGRKPETSRKR